MTKCEGAFRANMLMWDVYSTTRSTGPLPSDQARSDGYEYRWGTTHLRDHHIVYHVLPGAGGILKSSVNIISFWH